MKDIKILILEDHSLTNNLLICTLNSLGYKNVFSANCGRDALSLLLKEAYFDILISDIIMPEFDGIDFLREAAALGDIKSLIISSEIEEDLRTSTRLLAKLYGYEILGDLAKPFSKDSLKILLERHEFTPRQKKIMRVDELPRAHEIQQALLDGEFHAVFQPKFSLSDLAPIGAEALIRWQHPERGLLTPGIFLAEAIRLGHMDELTDIILKETLELVSKSTLPSQFKFSINLEVEQLSSLGLPQKIDRLFRDYNVNPSNIIFELTESSLMQAPTTSIENLVRLRLLGCGISIDDFGAGFSSLQRVCELPCTELKLDASFTWGLSFNARTAAAIRSVVQLSNSLNISVVAEGIETTEQLEHLKALNVDIGQGYLYSIPLNKKDLMSKIQNHYSSCLTI